MNRAGTELIFQDGVIELDGQFFLQQQDRAQSEFQHLTGEKSVPKRMARRFKQNVKLNAAYCEAKGIPYLHVVYPSKAMAFRDAFAAAGTPLTGIFTDVHRTDAVIYPLDDLDGAEDFERRGSHCSDAGSLKIAGIAFRAIGMPIDEYRPVFSKGLRKCDLAHMRGLPMQELVTIRAYEGLAPDIREFTNRPMLPGNRGQISYSWNQAAPIDARILLFGDSFFALSLPVLAPLFRELIYLRRPYVMEDVADALAPDVILTGNTERYLVNVPDKTCDSPFFTNFLLRGLQPDELDAWNRDALHALFTGRNGKEFKRWQRKTANLQPPGPEPSAPKPGPETGRGVLSLAKRLLRR